MCSIPGVAEEDVWLADSVMKVPVFPPMYWQDADETEEEESPESVVSKPQEEDETEEDESSEQWFQA
ncbi:hypothetical protein JTE90_022548 [Oedothorax gibbosus]|uniref:Uncharacterized protein n=1 Tax=Oedothorax gibbosus TaxID=931172 RepID=A0AAV6TLM7_9ARAC|nr:hypothetical protein JTE90_022548 [Oedothorax gibbosus]